MSHYSSHLQQQQQQTMEQVLKSQDVEIDSDVVQVVHSESSKPDSLHGSLPKFAMRFKTSSSKYLSATRDDLDGEEEEEEEKRQHSTDFANPDAGDSLSADIDSRQDLINRAFAGKISSGGSTAAASEGVNSPDNSSRSNNGSSVSSHPHLTPGSVHKAMSSRGLDMQSSDIYSDKDSAATVAFQKINKNSASPAKATVKKATRSATKLFTGGKDSSSKKSSGSKSAGGSEDRPLSPSSGSGKKGGKKSKKYDMKKMNSQASEEPKVDGRPITQKHSQYALTYGMMMGIRVSAGRFAGPEDDDDFNNSNNDSQMSQTKLLTALDYNLKTKINFPPEGSSGGGSDNTNEMLGKISKSGIRKVYFPTPPHKLNFMFKFKDYAPKVFKTIRTVSGISEEDYMESVAGDFNYIEFIANSKSGQFFFYSHDGKYMIKTQTKAECVLLLKILPEYVEHLDQNRNSLLVRFYGMHRVTMKNLGKSIYFVIMSSVFDTDKSIHVKYDLKGSTVGRVTSQADCDAGAVQKDCNLMESGRLWYMGKEMSEKFREILIYDSEFLAKLKIMDYSLLVGIHNARDRRSVRRSSSVVRPSDAGSSSSMDAAQAAAIEASLRVPHALDDRPLDINQKVGLFQAYHGGIQAAQGVYEIYFVGIIDILQLYNSRKRGETFFKGFGENARQISAVDPVWYGQRFVNFLMNHTDYNEEHPNTNNEYIPANLKNKGMLHKVWKTLFGSSSNSSSNNNNNNGSSGSSDEEEEEEEEEDSDDSENSDDSEGESNGDGDGDRSHSNGHGQFYNGPNFNDSHYVVHNDGEATKQQYGDFHETNFIPAATSAGASSTSSGVSVGAAIRKMDSVPEEEEEEEEDVSSASEVSIDASEVSEERRSQHDLQQQEYEPNAHCSVTTTAAAVVDAASVPAAGQATRSARSILEVLPPMPPTLAGTTVTTATTTTTISSRPLTSKVITVVEEEEVMGPRRGGRPVMRQQQQQQQQPSSSTVTATATSSNIVTGNSRKARAPPAPPASPQALPKPQSQQQNNSGYSAQSQGQRQGQVDNSTLLEHNNNSIRNTTKGYNSSNETNSSNNSTSNSLLNLNNLTVENSRNLRAVTAPIPTPGSPGTTGVRSGSDLQRSYSMNGVSGVSANNSNSGVGVGGGISRSNSNGKLTLVEKIQLHSQTIANSTNATSGLSGINTSSVALSSPVKPHTNFRDLRKSQQTMRTPSSTSTPSGAGMSISSGSTGFPSSPPKKDFRLAQLNVLQQQYNDSTNNSIKGVGISNGGAVSAAIGRRNLSSAATGTGAAGTFAAGAAMSSPHPPRRPISSSSSNNRISNGGGNSNNNTSSGSNGNSYNRLNPPLSPSPNIYYNGHQDNMSDDDGYSQIDQLH